MCELFAVSASKKIRVNHYLENLKNHSHHHPDGWGMAVFDDSKVSLKKEACPAFESDMLAGLLQAPIEAQNMIGHIRLATRGELILENCHPFVFEDSRKRAWTMAHNGTIFSSEILDKYTDQENGSTDSERIILHIINVVEKEYKEKNRDLSIEERCKMMDSIVLSIARPNKLNLMVYDGEVLYVHTNMKDTLFVKHIKEGILFGTTPMDDDKDSWQPLEMMRMFAYKDGKKIFSGTKHDYEYFLDQSV